MYRRATLIIFLSIATHFIWFLDANPLLYFYDIYITIFATHDSVDRRVFLPDSLPQLENKKIWITGASSGIGAELAIQLSYTGVSHLILSGRNINRLESVAQSCRHDEREIQVSAEPTMLDEAVQTALEAASSGIDILVLNAGQYQLSPALETKLDDAIPQLMQTNFIGPASLSQKLIQNDKWKERGYGHIVTVASLMARGASPLNSVYSSTKHALRSYFASLAAEERSWLRVDIVLPGATATNLWSSSLSGTSIKNDSPNQLLHADDRSKMAVQRCAQLIISSLIGPNFLFYETWITRQPGLLWVYLASHAPSTFQLATNIIAPLRLDMWRRNGEDALYLPTLLLNLWKNRRGILVVGDSKPKQRKEQRQGKKETR